MSIGKIKWQSIVAKYAYPETWRSLWQVFNSVIPFFVLWYLAYRSLEIGYWLTLSAVPGTLTSFRQYQWEIRNRMAAFLLQEGVFTPISDKLTVYVRSRGNDGALYGIMVDDGREASAHATILAEKGQLLEGANGPRVLLMNGSRQEIDRKSGRLNILTFRENEIDLGEAAKEQGARILDMSEVSLRELLDPHPVHARDAPRWYAEGHKRLTLPLTTLSYA
ncbi:MAG TPA: LptF/LptG family permease, partial [Anaerolineales bacterium]|nr:LptF/LptG family permease [Anaerolineales bacterium]